MRPLITFIVCVFIVVIFGCESKDSAPKNSTPKVEKFDLSPVQKHLQRTQVDQLLQSYDRGELVGSRSSGYEKAFALCDRRVTDQESVTYLFENLPRKNQEGPGILLIKVSASSESIEEARIAYPDW